MSRKTVTFAGETSLKFVPNSRRNSDYKSTIQNLTDQSITITVTNEDIQSASPTFDTPAAGALVIAVGVIDTLDEPYDGWLITPAAAATGTVNIFEAG